MKTVGEHIEGLKPYKPGKPISELKRELGIDEAVKLASNENPLGPSPKAVAAMSDALGTSNIYPDGGAFALKKALSEKFSVAQEQLLIGNGSNEVISMLIRTFCLSGTTNIVISKYAFIAYKLVATGCNVAVKEAQMRPGYVHDLDAILAEIDDETRMVFVANPNNPTGTYVTASEIEAFLTKVPDDVFVVFDEAYVEYAQAADFASAHQFRTAHPKLAVLRTFSKCYGLAGLRCGFAMTDARWVDYANRVREPFNCNMFAQIGAAAAVFDDDFVKRSVEVNESGRKQLTDGLTSLATVIPSQTNFLLLETKKPGVEIYEALLQEGVIVRPLAGYGLTDHVRVTIGTESQNAVFLDAFKRLA